MNNGYTTAGSGKSQARHLFGVIVYCVMAGFIIAMTKGKDPNASWAAIITALTAPLGGAWIFSKWRSRATQSNPPSAGAPGKDGEA